MKLYEISHSEHFADTKQMSFPPLALGWPQDLILGGGVERADSNSTAKKSHHRHRLSERELGLEPRPESGIRVRMKVTLERRPRRQKHTQSFLSGKA